MLMYDCPTCPFPPLSVQAVLDELQQFDLITSVECRGLRYLNDVVTVQSGKSPEVQTKTAVILRKHGCGGECKRLPGKQTQPLIHLPVVCCTVEHSCKAHYDPTLCARKTQIFESFMQNNVGS